jgi:hypothetical protein
MPQLCWFPNPAATHHTRFSSFLFSRSTFRTPSLERYSSTPLVSHKGNSSHHPRKTWPTPRDQMYKALYNLVANTFPTPPHVHRGCSCLDLQSRPHLKSVAILRVISNQDLQSRHACVPMYCTGFPSCWLKLSQGNPLPACIGATTLICIPQPSATTRAGG